MFRHITSNKIQNRRWNGKLNNTRKTELKGWTKQNLCSLRDDIDFRLP